MTNAVLLRALRIVSPFCLGHCITRSVLECRVRVKDVFTHLEAKCIAGLRRTRRPGNPLAARLVAHCAASLPDMTHDDKREAGDHPHRTAHPFHVPCEISGGTGGIPARYCPGIGGCARLLTAYISGCNITERRGAQLQRLTPAPPGCTCPSTSARPCTSPRLPARPVRCAPGAPPAPPGAASPSTPTKRCWPSCASARPPLPGAHSCANGSRSSTPQPTSATGK